MYLSKYGVARHIYIAIPKAGSANHAVGADWTPAAGDVKISKDGGAAANVTNLPTAIAMGNSAEWDFSLTATEMQAAQIVITVADSATKAVDDTGFSLETYGHASAQHTFDFSQATPSVNLVQILGTTLTETAGQIAAAFKKLFDVGAPVLTATSVNQTGDNYARLGAPAGASHAADTAAIYARTDVATSTRASQTSLDTLDDYVDTEVAAIKAKTDQLTFTVANVLDANVLRLNGDAAAAATLAILNGATVVYRGTVTGAATTTTLIDSGLTQADADWWKGRIIIFTSVLTLQATDITAFDPTTDELTFTAVTNAPTGATYVII